MDAAATAKCTSDVVHVPGLSNMVADHLSGPMAPVGHVATHQLLAAPTCQVAALLDTSAPDTNTTPSVVDYATISAAQWSCPGVAALHAASSLTIVKRDMEGNPLEGDITTGVFRPCHAMPLNG